MSYLLDRPMRLAIYFNQHIHAGGGYQQALNAVLLAKELPQDVCTVLCFTTTQSNIDSLKAYGIDAILFPLSKWQRVILNIRGRLKWYAVKWIRFLFGLNKIEAFFVQYEVDLVYFISPTRLAHALEKLNYITTVWDICHRDHPEFPEVRDYREFERREELYRNILSKAFAVLVDSPESRKNIVHCYGLDDSRVYVMPFSPAISTDISDDQYYADFVDMKLKYKIQYDYIFYPAQFWAHKNHVYILQGLKILEQQYGVKLGAVFSGEDSGGNLWYVQQNVRIFSLEDRIYFTGFVPNKDIPYLYRQSIALVMPTYFGLTNLPPLEAFRLGVPVLYSDLPGLKEQVAGAALLVDLKDPHDLAKKLYRLIADAALRRDLIDCGRKKSIVNSPTVCLEILLGIIRDFAIKRKCWY